ncbi:hypothetical protein HDU92_003090 [Lobulomyces angularis]|nr:hypothetical protein HDU92_003090 [Lobulomyces angularis]
MSKNIFLKQVKHFFKIKLSVKKSNSRYENHTTYYPEKVAESVFLNLEENNKVDDLLTSEVTSASEHKFKICIICQDLKEYDINFPKVNFCKLEHTKEELICFACFETYLNETLKNKLYACCPFDKNVLDYQIIKKYSSPETFKEFDYNLTKEVLNRSKWFRWCKSCSSGQFFIKGKKFEQDNKISCFNCGAFSCFKHNIAWHEGLTCKQYENKLRKFKNENKKSHIYIKNTSSKCPKCPAYFVKVSGCDHITCGNILCGYEFCYVCESNYEDIKNFGNHRHKITCRHFFGIS